MGRDTDTLALVFAGGDAPHADDLRDVDDPTLVIAADSGLHHATALGYHVDLVVGDLDSVHPEAFAAAVAAGTEVEEHASAKDATDLELALLRARDRGCTRLVVVGGHGGRLDHFLANVLALTSTELATVRVEARLDGATLVVVRGGIDLTGRRGDIVTLLAVGGPARGVTTRGLRYPLLHETLHPGSSRGVSNEFSEPNASVTVGDGMLLAVLPHPVDSHREEGS